MSIIPIGTQEIATDRLMLRPFSYEDYRIMFKNLTGREEVTKYLDWEIHQTMGYTRNVLKSWVDKYSCGYYFNWGIYMDDQLIGAIRLNELNLENNIGEIGFCICPEYWGRGIATEALGFCLEFLTGTAGLEAIFALCDKENIPSQRVLTKCDFTLFDEGNTNKRGNTFAFVYSRKGKYQRINERSS